MNYQLPFKPTDSVLELGGGSNPRFRPNFDIRPLQNVDRVIDFNKSLPIPDNSYNGLYSSYLLEHISWRSINQFLKEIYRILKPSGIVIFITANLLEQARVLINTPPGQWNDKLISMIFGDQNFENNEWMHNAHYCGYSPEYITKILENIGFKNIEIIPIQTEVGPTDMIVQATK